MVRKNIHKNERMFRGLILRNITNGRSELESVDKYKENSMDEHINILCSVCSYVRRNNLRTSEIWTLRA